MRRNVTEHTPVRKMKVLSARMAFQVIQRLKAKVIQNLWKGQSFLINIHLTLSTQNDDPHCVPCHMHVRKPVHKLPCQRVLQARMSSLLNVSQLIFLQQPKRRNRLHDTCICMATTLPCTHLPPDASRPGLSGSTWDWVVLCLSSSLGSLACA